MSHAECRRKQILEAAERLLAHYGPAKTTVADIAREAQVGVGTVYLEFPSKDAIVEALSTDRHRAVIEAMRAASRRKGPFGDRLCAIFEARVEAYLTLSRAGIHAAELVRCTTPGMKQCHVGFMAEQRALLASFLEEAAVHRELDVLRPDETASTLLRCYAGFAPPWLLEQPEAEMRAALAAMHQLVLRGLLKRLREVGGVDGTMNDFRFRSSVIASPSPSLG